jgi:methionyl-tRNA synthetase
MITFEDFQKLEIRIGQVLTAEKIENTDRLLKLTVDFGEEKRQIISGIAVSFPEPEVLIGKKLPFLVNIEPRELKGFLSEGMILAIDNEKPVMLIPQEDVPSGSLIK